MSTVRIDPKRWAALKKLEVDLTTQKKQIVRKSEIINFLIDQAEKSLAYDKNDQTFKIKASNNNKRAIDQALEYDQQEVALIKKTN